MQSRQRAVRVAFVAGAMFSVLASAAFGCTNLASINLSSSHGKPGDAIVVTGSGFSGGMEGPMEGMDMAAMDMADMASTSGLAVRPPVVLRWNGTGGPELTTAIVDRTGSISVTFTLPEVPPGHYTILAVQKNAQGYDVYGTPARATVEVTATGVPSLDRVGPGATAATPSGSSGVLLLTIGLGVAGLSLFGLSGVAVARHASRRRAPAAAPVKTNP